MPVQGVKDGFHWRVPKDWDEARRKMTYWELVDNFNKMAEEAADILERNRRVRATWHMRGQALDLQWPCLKYW